MRKGNDIGKWMPLEIEALLSDEDVVGWFDDQCWWYVRLILCSWKFSEYPAHLPNDPGRLMAFAGISMREPARVEAWKRRGGAVLKKFRETEDGKWIFHPKTIEVYARQLAKLEARRDAGSKGGIARASKHCYSNARDLLQQSASKHSLSLTNTSSQLKEEVQIQRIDSEELVSKVMGIGFRDSTYRSKDLIARALYREVQEQGSEPRELLASLCRIYVWTEKGVWAPKCYEVIPRWREPQELWERRDGKNQPSRIESSQQAKASAISRAFDRYRQPAGQDDAGDAGILPKRPDH